MANLSVSRHRNFYVAVTLGVIVGVLTFALNRPIAVFGGVDTFFLVYLLLTWGTSHKLSAKFLRAHAAQDDAPAPFILLVMLAAVAAAAVSLFLVLRDREASQGVELWLSSVSVVLGWFAVHTMWAMHYAFEYYQAPDEEQGKPKSGKVQAGLDFPGGEEPNGVAFFYFAYVVGMTAQTSDTEITTNAMRRLVVVHGVFSFFFNTVIVAAAVNIVVAFAH